MIDYNDLNKWDVCLAAVKFEDKPEMVKNRPVVIYDKQEAFLLSFKVTGQPLRECCKGEYILQEWEAAGLDTVSVVRTSKRLKLEPKDFTKKLGRLRTKDIMALKVIMMGW